MRRRQVMPSMFGVARRDTLAKQRDHELSSEITSDLTQPAAAAGVRLFCNRTASQCGVSGVKRTRSSMQSSALRSHPRC
jgi:hypothetical protein